MRSEDKTRGDAGSIEELAANAWPAFVVQVVDGWRLRFTPGIRVRRSNSVLPMQGRDRVPLEERLAVAEGFYATREMPARYHISPAAWPEDLDRVLEDRGFEVEAAADVQTASIHDVVARTSNAAPAAEVADELEDRWLAIADQMFRRGDVGTMRRTILERIGPAVGFALLEMDGAPAAVAMGVVERSWLGIYSMGTRPEFRRRGAATSVLNTLARWAHDRGAENAYLQVEAENDVAHRLYERAGFHTAYTYHYRTRPQQ